MQRPSGSFVSPTLGLYFSSTIYTLWNAYLITGYGVLHPQKAMALHMVLFMKIILSILQHLSVSSFLGPAWCLIVPSLMTYNLGNGVIVGHMMLQLGRSGISQVIFPPLVSFEKITDFGGLDKLVSSVSHEKFNITKRSIGYHFQARHIVPGLHESVQVIASKFGMRIRIEQIVGILPSISNLFEEERLSI
jgi:hypothetical protein